MKIKEIYVANDGTVFKNRDECENYEMQVNSQTFEAMINNGHIKMWAYDYIDHKKGCYIQLWSNGHPDSVLGMARFIKILTEEAYKILQDQCKKFNIDCPPGVGNWFWVEDDDNRGYRWENPEEYFQEAIEAIDFCRKNGMIPKAE